MRLAHSRLEIELHELSRGEGKPLLLLHQLYGTAADWSEGFASWRGPVHALDFAGHGRSQWVKGGAYTPEILAGDVDAALRHIGPAALVGAGIGAYVALLVAAARRDAVTAAVLLPGLGLDGRGAVPDFDEPSQSIADLAEPRSDCDPMVVFLERDIRPLDYVEPFARQAQRLVLVEDGTPRPSWWNVVRDVDDVRIASSLAEALDHL
jgi:pimeloyl-ACP methyl ester carboxylesterase